ncbi:PAS-domain containing protein [Cypionkella sp.]|uniref:PAS-domain containing protein n=1 Tax=Cypionkella sp. TaxID=2811411 RepID=UPI00375118DC
MDWQIFFAALAAGLTAAAVGMIALWFSPRQLAVPENSLFATETHRAILLFDGEDLIDSTPEARGLLAASQTPGSNWEKLLAFLAPRFEGLETRLLQLPEDGRLEAVSTGPAPALTLGAELRGGLTKIELTDTATQGTDPMVQRAVRDEVALLREAIAAAPMLVWRENAKGEVIWANGPYLLQSCAVLTDGKELGWPLPKLFTPASAHQDLNDHWQSLKLPSGKQSWFTISSKAESLGWLRYGVQADAAVQAEASLREFMQTLTKTFAQLPIGLAVFDVDRKLQLFNPALLNLTQLPADFLSTRPTLLSVLDAMRDRKMLPEPKDYPGWRRQLVEMEKAASAGLYEETWNLPDGQTYKVVGRPHPNGAIALMIEDISTEMLRTRRFRADLEIGQSVIDQIEDAMAVFDQGGLLVMSNAAYARLWGHDPSGWVDDCNLRNLTTHWRNLSSPTGLWAEVEDYVATIGDREAWQAEARLLDGRLLGCWFAPLAGGSTLTRFRLQQGKQSVRPKLTPAPKRRRA